MKNTTGGVQATRAGVGAVICVCVTCVPGGDSTNSVNSVNSVGCKDDVYTVVPGSWRGRLSELSQLSQLSLEQILFTTTFL